MVLTQLKNLSYKLNDTTVTLHNRLVVRRPMSFPTEVGLMSSRICTANCVFCPIHHYKSEKKPFMSLGIARRVADDLIREGYSGTINLGENGDALLNPEFKEIFLEMKKTKGKQILVTNMKYMTKDLSKFLLENGLQRLVCNFDGATKETYEAMKTGCNFEDVRNNIHAFIEQRDLISSSCRIQINAVPIRRYLQYVEKAKSKLPYDYAENERYWKKYLGPNDAIMESQYIGSWGRRDFHSKMRTKPCYSWSFNACLIDTEGDVYPCCMDYKTQLSLGNVMNSTIREIWNGEKRKRFIANIVKNDFAAIGKPCINCGVPNDDIKSYLNYLKYRLFYR